MSELISLRLGNNKLVNTSSIQGLRGPRMNRKVATLSSYSARGVVRQENAHILYSKRILLDPRVDDPFRVHGVDCAVTNIAAFYCKECSNERILRPIEKPCWQTMMLRVCKPLPFILGLILKERHATYLKEFEQLLLEL